LGKYVDLCSIGGIDGCTFDATWLMGWLWVITVLGVEILGGREEVITGFKVEAEMCLVGFTVLCCTVVGFTVLLKLFGEPKE
jgi:hypothetical protein